MHKTYIRTSVDGRQLHFLALPGTDLFKFEIVNMMGSNIERTIAKTTDKNLYGISHFIEHLGFRAPKDYTTEELMKMIKTEGSYNASTDHDRINYWFKTNTDRFTTAIKLVCNYALNDLKNISEEEFEIEKKVVFNEAKRYADDDQTMFYFNMTPALCGYHVEDNVIGIPDTINTFTLADAIKVKETFLQYGKMIVNITYDPEKISQDTITEYVTEAMDRFVLPSTIHISDEKNPLELHDEMLALPTMENVLLMENDADQAMVGLTLDVVDNIVTANTGNSYLSRYAKDSLNDVIRERHGLTYGIQFYASNISYTPYTFFMCDVSKGDEDLLIKLFKESINTTVDAFDEEAHANLLSIQDLKRTMAFVDLQQYEGLHWSAIWHPERFEKYKDILANNIDDLYKAYNDNENSFENVKAYLEKVRQVVNDNKFSKISNV